nr:ribonuclease P protein component [Anianabacter salinae]
MPPPCAEVSPGPAAFPRLVTLTERADFLSAARARRQAMPGFILQARKRSEGDPAPGAVRIGYTCSKKVGNAVARNRAKRRLRAIAREVMPQAARPGWDYVLIGRSGATADRPYLDLVNDLRLALHKAHGK